MKPRALVLSGYGFNCEKESKFSLEKAGALADIVHLNSLIEKPPSLEDYSLLLIGGGFSFGDDLGSGVVVANKLRSTLREPLAEFIAQKKLVMGICNGFQVLVKLGLLPIPDFEQRVTLTFNDSGHFEDRWINLKINSASPSVYTREIDFLSLPVRHGEGKFVPRDESVLRHIVEENLVAAQYCDEQGRPSGYPANPNGSIANVAALCDPTGRVFGMMPHPEAFNNPFLSPAWPTGSVTEGMGLRIFKNAVAYLVEHH